jgi:hypothetical protein
MKSVASLVIGTAFIAAVAAPALAQARPSTPAKSSATASSSSDKGELGVAYSFLHLGGENAGGGFDAYFAKNFRSNSMGSLAIVGDFSFNHGNGGSIEFYTGGVRQTFKTKSKLKVYGQATLGLVHDDNAFVLIFGGGVKYPIHPKIDFFSQVDFPIAFFSGDTQGGVRWNIGVAIPIK